MEVRRLDQGADGSRVAEVWRTTWADTYVRSLGAETLASMLADIDASDMDRPGVAAFGVEVEGALVATGFCREVGKVAYVWGMYVLPSHQRVGHGRAVLSAIADHVSTARYLEVRVLPSSEIAHDFYVKSGFRQVSEEQCDVTQSVRATTRVMALDLLGPPGLALRAT